MKLEGRTVLITGASQGIGAATARAFADHGVRLALLARSADRLQALAEELTRVRGVQALTVVADVSHKDEVLQAVAAVEQTFGAVDILINNAGVGMRSPVGEIDLAAAHHVFAVNYWGAIHCIEAVLPGMKARGDGLIVNISSIIGRRAMPHAAIYCGSKFALNALSESMRLELHGRQVRVVTFYPGVTRTDFSRNELTGDASAYSRNRAPKTPVEVTAKAIVKAAQREPRDAYATLFDRVFAWGAALAPGLMDRMLLRFYR